MKARDRVYRALVLVYLSPSWAVSSLLRTFVWCALCLTRAPPSPSILGVSAAGARMYRETPDIWWGFYDIPQINKTIEQVFLWCVFFDYSLMLVMAPHKLSHVISASSLLDLFLDADLRVHP